jgi:anthranilate phosphoribosyltransferase
LIEFLKKVGVGKSKQQSLNYEEAYQANQLILNGKSTDIQTGFFWGALRLKGETDEELQGFLDALKEETNYIDLDDIQPVDLAVPYDGKNRSLYILPASIFIATGSGAKIVGHGAEDVPSKYGITYHQILNLMGCMYLSNEEEIKKAIDLSGFTFYHQKYLNPKLFSLLPKRQEFGLRTYINTLEKLLNPFKTTKVLIGVKHTPYIQKYIELGYFSGFKDIYVVKGLEGGIEPYPDKETKIYTSKIFSIKVIPKDLEMETLVKSKNLSVKDNVDICLSILKNEDNPFKNWALITASLLIVAYGLTEDLKEALSMAEESLNSGSAYESFEIYRSLSVSRKIA